MAATMSGSVAVRGGGILTNQRPVFTSDSKCLLVCSGHRVKIISCLSGECIRELTGHRSNVNGVHINPWNKLQVLTSSEDGTVFLWDYMDNVILKTIKFDRPLYGLFLHEAHKNVLFVLCKKMDDNGQILHKKPLRLCMASIPSGTSNKTPLTPEFVIVVGSGGDRCISFGANGQYMACVMGNNLKVYNFDDKTIQRTEMKVKPTCLACHPHDNCIAVGDVKGQVSIVWNIFQQESITKSINHWHALPVQDVSFSPEGTYLFSGGHECTLVQWQYNSKHKDFMPRLGNAITHIACAPNGQLRALSLRNNSILLLTTKVMHTIQGLDHSSFHQKQSNPVPTGLAVDPRTDALVLNGKLGHLQFYQLGKDKLLYNMDITGENYISPENLHKPLAHTEVTHMTFDLKGEWMVTAERRDDGETSVEMRLKFWEFDAKKQSFTLNTTVEMPHQEAINALSFRPSSKERKNDDAMVVTTSADGKFKLWVLVDDTDVEKAKHCWNCESVGFYKNTEPRAAAFSSDGSLLGVGFSEVITLWNPEVNELRKILTHAAVSTEIQSLCFGHGSSAHLLVSSTSSSITVWNLLTCRVSWSVSMPVNILIGDPYSQHFAIFDNKNNLFVFDGCEPRPVFYQPSTSSSEVLSAIFTPRQSPGDGNDKEGLPNDALPWQQDSELYFMTKSQELLTLISKGQAKKEERTNIYDAADLQGSIPLTPFAQLLGGASRPVWTDGGSQAQSLTSSKASAAEILAAPPHILPPASHLCSSFILSLLGPASHFSNTGADSESEDSDDEDHAHQSSLDSDMETEDVHVAPPMATEASTSLSLVIEEEAELSEKEMKKLAKAAKTSFNWIQRTSDVPSTS
ncbi:WD repeat-containing protein 75 [Strongylocentrotus purpuratus]|uniref:WD repeat-containing protein 75 second beta-propeller domain-containing protein n=1 Tax=Strongylocentrotus purpuratus TaxID=7668 RepID=A0A7M7P707_STRPU|nr:WD repeat-containing protein 75 [Strongylocentrotus purpuratus]